MSGDLLFFLHQQLLTGQAVKQVKVDGLPLQSRSS